MFVDKSGRMLAWRSTGRNGACPRIWPFPALFVELDSDMDHADDLRIWRLRKRNLYVDAELKQVHGTDEWDLCVYYGTTLTSSRRCATRTEAVAEAKARRAELEREGWTFHW